MKKEIMQKTGVVFFLAMICCVLWGSAFPCIKIGYQFFKIESGDSVSQIVFAGCRFALAGLMVIILGSVMEKKPLIPKKGEMPRILILSMAQTIIQYLFYYIGLAHTSGVKSAIIIASNTFFAIFISSLIYHQEKLTAKKLIGCLIGFVGVVLINLTSGGLDMGIQWNGELFILFAAIASAMSTVMIKKYSTMSNPVLLSGWQFFIGGIVMAAIGKAMGGSLTFYSGSCMGMLLYLAVVSAVSYTLWSLLLKYNPVSRVTVFGFMNPVFGVVLSALLLKENGQAFSLQGLASLILVCIGIYVVNKAGED